MAATNRARHLSRLNQRRNRPPSWGPLPRNPELPQKNQPPSPARCHRSNSPVGWTDPRPAQPPNPGGAPDHHAGGAYTPHPRLYRTRSAVLGQRRACGDHPGGGARPGSWSLPWTRAFPPSPPTPSGGSPWREGSARQLWAPRLRSPRPPRSNGTPTAPRSRRGLGVHCGGRRPGHLRGRRRLHAAGSGDPKRVPARWGRNRRAQRLPEAMSCPARPS